MLNVLIFVPLFKHYSYLSKVNVKVKSVFLLLSNFNNNNNNDDNDNNTVSGYYSKNEIAFISSVFALLLKR